MPKISVIVPVYKVEQYLNRCVDSLLNQTFTDFELILVDDGSLDESGVICDEYAASNSRVIVIHKENGGLSDARNYGINWAFANSDSDWITFIDSDDWVHRCYLEILFNTCVDNSVSLSSCGYIRTSNQCADNDIQNVRIIIDNPEHLIEKRLKGNGFNEGEYNASIACGRLFRKTLWENIRFPFGKLHEDEYTVHKVIYANDKIAVVPESLYYYFQNEDGIILSNMSTKRLNDRLEAVEKRIDYYYRNKYYSSLSYKLKVFFYIINEAKEISGKNLEFIKIIKKYEKKFKKRYKDYYDYLPQLMQKYGYKRYMSGRAEKLNGFWNDYKLIKKDKGIFYSLLWVAKNYWKI